MTATDTIVVGGGHAGLALSRALTDAGHDHVVLERGRIGERWRSERWDSLRLLTPNRLNALPGAPALADPDGHLGAQGFADHLERYAASFGAPVVEEAAVRRVTHWAGRFRVHSDAGSWHARNLVLATGAVPRVPAAAGMPTGVTHLHTARYRSPEALPCGGVLVVGAGAAGRQIAYELRLAGRHVVLAAGERRLSRGPDLAALTALGVVVSGRLRSLGDGVAELAPAGDEPTTLRLRPAGIRIVIWATGYRRAYPWLRIPGALDRDCGVVGQHGATRVPGLHVLGHGSARSIADAGREAALLAARLHDSPLLQEAA